MPGCVSTELAAQEPQWSNQLSISQDLIGQLLSYPKPSLPFFPLLGLPQEGDVVVCNFTSSQKLWWGRCWKLLGMEERERELLAIYCDYSHWNWFILTASNQMCAICVKQFPVLKALSLFISSLSPRPHFLPNSMCLFHYKVCMLTYSLWSDLRQKARISWLPNEEAEHQRG